MSHLQVVSLVLATIAGLGTLGAAVWAVSRAQSLSASVADFTVANAEYREQVSALRSERDLDRLEHEKSRDLDRLEFERAMAAQERECATQIAELRGQVGVLTGTLADRIVAAVFSKLTERGITS